MKVGGFQIAPPDCEMNILKFPDALKLNDDFAFGEEIQAVLADLMITIKEGYWVLSDELDSAQRKLNCKRFSVQ